MRRSGARTTSARIGGGRGGRGTCGAARRTRAAFASAACLAAVLGAARPGRADEPDQAGLRGPVLVDAVAVRWHAPELGGPAQPKFVLRRELAFEARVEALADSFFTEPVPFRDRHVRAALDRHVAETILASLPIVPAPEPREVLVRAEAARAMLEQRARGRERLLAAAGAEGIGAGELDAILRRQARASLYLDRMVAPMLQPTELELRDVLRSGATPFGKEPFEKVAPALARWYVGRKLAQALDTYFQAVRSRVTLVILRPPAP